MSDAAYSGLCGGNVRFSGAATRRICIESFAAAIADAATYFKNEASHVTTVGLPYLISIDPGIYDLSAQNPATGYDVKGVLDVSDLKSTSSERLVVSGAGADTTQLVTSYQLPTIFGRGISHFTVQNLHLARDTNAATQGEVVDMGSGYVTLRIQPLFHGPDFGYRSGHGSSSSVRYMRRYDNTDPGNPKLVTDPSNGQVAWASYLKLSPTDWKIILDNASFDPANAGYAIGAFVCLKNETASSNVGYFNDLPSGGSDVVFSGVTMTKAGRIEFNSLHAIKIVDSRIVRDAPNVNGQAPCLSTDSGGLQIGNRRSGMATYGNVVSNYTAQATGDDSIAFFNDIGGFTPDFPASSVSHSTIADGFARFILVFSAHAYGGLGWGGQTDGNIYIDCPTQARAGFGVNFSCPLYVQTN